MRRTRRRWWVGGRGDGVKREEARSRDDVENERDGKREQVRERGA